MIPSCDHTGTAHFHSSVTRGSACLISARRRASIGPRQSPRLSMRASISADADSVVGGLFFMAATSAACLDHLPPVARWVAEARVHVAVAVHRLLRELDRLRTRGVEFTQEPVDRYGNVDASTSGGIAPLATIARTACAVAASSTGGPGANSPSWNV